jgi:hypothetical protein
MTDRLKPLLTAAVASAFLTVALARGQPPPPGPAGITVTTKAVMVKKAAEPVIVKQQVRPAEKGIRLEVEALRRRIEGAFREKVPVAVPMPIMMPPAPAVVQMQNRDAMVQQWAQQFEPQIRPLLRVEYRFMRTVCTPTKEQRLPIVHQSEAWLKAAARQYAEWQMNGQRVAGRPAPSPDFRTLLVEQLARSVKEHLTPEQFQRYRKELDARTDDEKQVGLQNLLARLDQSLMLSADQRDRIAASLSKGWDEEWSQHLQIFRIADQYMPSIPGERVVPFLDPTQKEIWSGLQKIGHVNFGISNVGNNDAGPLDEDWPDEPKAKP